MRLACLACALCACNQLAGIENPEHWDASRVSDGAPASDAPHAMSDAGSRCEVAAPKAARVVGVRTLGVQTQPPAVLQRNVTASLALGSRAVWAFGGALLGVTSADGVRFLSSTAAESTLGDPVHLLESLDSLSVPKPLIPLTAEETAFNTGDSGDAQIWILPQSITAASSGTDAIVFYGKYLVRPDLNWTRIAGGIARLRDGAITATRDAQYLFNAPEPLFLLGGIVFDDYLHLYACNGSNGCTVARAPLATIDRHDAWSTFSDSDSGSKWISDLAGGSVVLENVGGAISVSQNAHLGSLLAVYSEPFSSRIVVRTAPRPEGPWTAPELAFDSHESGDFGAVEHAAFSKNCGELLLISYSHPVSAYAGSVQLVEATLE